ncbi:MAG: CHASE domain-containing protein [Kofleriaceae bacterium]
MEPSHEQLRRARPRGHARLRWFHWLALLLVAGMSMVAWFEARRVGRERLDVEFRRESAQIVELVTERMQQYEGGLWGSAGAIAMIDRAPDDERWARFTSTLRLDVRYPGINGLGLTYLVKELELDAFVAQRREARPGFQVHPPVEQEEHWVIASIEPIERNREALGLDLAHETHRLAAARLARDTGEAQVTGPIVLVQDQARTPGFLFLAPFYRPGPIATVAERRERFVGLVYAPFIVHELLAGALAQTRRRVDVTISDGPQTLYQEQSTDARPLVTTSRRVPMYGRTWTFDLRAGASFRTVARQAQPVLILISGVVITLLLLFIFIFSNLSRALKSTDESNRELAAQALELREKTDELRRSTGELAQRNDEMAKLTLELERSNADLEKFAYVTSHDLQEPLRMVACYTELLATTYQDSLDDRAHRYLAHANGGAKRMQALIRDLLSFARVRVVDELLESVDCDALVTQVAHDLHVAVSESGGRITHQALPTIRGHRSQLGLLFQNLLGNALKFHGDAPPEITITAERTGSAWQFAVRDNGVGFAMEYAERVFEPFQRLHTRDAYDGTGMGLAICKRIVSRHGGRIWVESQPGCGATFYFTVEDRRPEDLSPARDAA